VQRNRSLEQYLLTGAILTFFVWVTLPVLQPILIGLLLAMVFYPVYAALLARKVHSAPAALLCSLALVIVVILPVTYLIIVLAQDIPGWIEQLSQLIKGQESSPSGDGHFAWLKQRIETALSALPFESSLDTDTLLIKIKDFLIGLGTFTATLVGVWIKRLPSLAMETIFLLLGFYFGLVDGPKLTKYLRQILPFSKTDVGRFFSATASISRGVVIGSLTAGLVQGLLICIAYWIFGVPKGIFVGVLTIVFSFVPFLGSMPAGIGGIIYLLADNRVGAAVGMLIAFGITSTADTLIKPLALKGSMEIHPLLAFVSVIGGLSAFGIAGIFLGPIIAALTITSFEILRTGEV
jgi:predicted PurR-regulated permease PerM